ncbi:MAG: hypothetical protein HY579_11700 [Nitrospinae bacterium]|nr:hypothetical protein [Nitrospinota bacterium]
MVRKTVVSIFTALAFVTFGASAYANVNVVKKGESSTCENASWVVYNLSETDDTNIEFDIGPHGFAWEKVWKVAIPAGGYETNAIAMKSTIKNAGPGDVTVNCQRQLFDRHDWKIDAGSGKTYQSNYQMDHVVPQTYIEPGFGQPEGTERDITGVIGGQRSEANR